jgi:NDP-sugar pyrophosphorylase family protein
VIRKGIEADFRDKVLSRFPKELDISFCFQELDLLPHGYECPNGRIKPWGTGHAVWAAKELIDEPFALANADDFYGRSGFQAIYDHFGGGSKKGSHLLVAYKVGQTLSEVGSVSRGLCKVSDQGLLEEVTEVEKIERIGGEIVAESDGKPVQMDDNSMVSMNLFGFGATAMKHVDVELEVFLKAKGNELKSEFYIPTVVNRLVKTQGEGVRVVTSEDRWMGVTNPDDKETLKSGIRNLIQSGPVSRTSLDLSKQLALLKFRRWDFRLHFLVKVPWRFMILEASI